MCARLMHGLPLQRLILFLIMNTPCVLREGSSPRRVQAVVIKTDRAKLEEGKEIIPRTMTQNSPNHVKTQVVTRSSYIAVFSPCSCLYFITGHLKEG